MYKNFYATMSKKKKTQASSKPAPDVVVFFFKLIYAGHSACPSLCLPSSCRCVDAKSAVYLDLLTSISSVYNQSGDLGALLFKCRRLIVKLIS